MASRTIEIAADNGQVYISGTYAMPSKLTRAAGSQTLAIMMHGFPGDAHGHDNLFGLVQSQLNDFGIHTLSFDCRGCGRSEGAPEHYTLARTTEDLALVLEWADQQMFEEIILIGEGLGAYYCLYAPHPKTKAIILFWPVIDLADYARRAFKADEILAHETGEKFVEIAGQKVSLVLMQEMMGAGTPPLPDLIIPVLVQYGINDTLTPPDRHIELLKDHLSARRLDLTGYQDGIHGLPDPKHRQTMQFHISQFIEKFG